VPKSPAEKQERLCARRVEARVCEAIRLAIYSHVRSGAQGDSIAIVAMSCNYPGSADTPEALWDLLQGGGDAISE
jgi:hypothetical protein